MQYSRAFTTFLFLIFAGTFCMMSSCKKIKQNYIMNGEWDVLEVTLNGGSLNQMEQFLPGFTTGSDCCSYVMSFEDEGFCSTILTIDGDITAYSEGEWDMPNRNQLYFKVDEYVDGTFDLSKEGDGVWILDAPVNNIEAYGVGLVEMRIRTRRIKN